MDIQLNVAQVSVSRDCHRGHGNLAIAVFGRHRSSSCKTAGRQSADSLSYQRLYMLQSRGAAYSANARKLEVEQQKAA